MTVNFTTTGQGIFARLGKLFGALSRMETFQSDIVDASGTSVQEALQEYINSVGATANTDIQFTQELTRDMHMLKNSIGGDFFRRVKSVAETTLVEMMEADLQGETPPSNLPRKTVKEALFELREQMLANSKTLDGSVITIGSTTAGGSNVGNGTVIVSAEADNAKTGTHGESLGTCRTETLRFRCIQDARNKKLAKGAEIFEVRGAASYGNDDHRWPGGSGYVGNYASTSPIVGDGRRQGRNMLRNSSFESFVANVPKNWLATTGSAGATIFEESSTVAVGSNALKMASDGSTNICVQQKFGDVGGGAIAGVKPDALYGVAILARKSGTGSSAGVLRVGLANASKTFATSNYFDIAHGTLSDSAYGIHTGSFRAATDLADPIYFTIEQQTAFTNGTNVFIDGVVFAEMIDTAAGGVKFLIVPGPTAFNIEDTFTVDVTNGDQGLMMRYMDRVFDLYGNGILPPVHLAGSENIADSLIA
jgi:hypothetical protein